MGMRAIAQPYKAPRILAQGGLPIGSPSSGTIGNNGALSAITALPTTYSGGIYLYFPADKIFAGSLAGHYYCVMSSATAGTIYNNTYTGGIPAIPASPTPFVTTGPGAYTQVTTEITALTLTNIVEANSLGIDGALDSSVAYSTAATAGAKTAVIKLAGTSINSLGAAASATAMSQRSITQNRGIATRQHTRNGSQASSTSQSTHTTIDTTIAMTISISHQLAVATDFMIGESRSFILRP